MFACDSRWGGCRCAERVGLLQRDLIRHQSRSMCKNRSVRFFVLPCATLLIFALAAMCPAKASGLFEGDWTFKYSCDNATSPYAEQFLRGEGDFFSLYRLTQDGNRICGYHIATSYGQQKVDEGDLTGRGPSIAGTVTGNVATVRFRAWTGAIGVATITLRNGSLAWHVVKRIDGQNWFPDDALLSRDVSHSSYIPIACGSAQISTDH